MPTFEYRGTSSEGEAVRGSLVGANLSAAAAELERRGFQVEHLAQTSAAEEQPVEGAGRSDPSILNQRHYVQTHVVGAVVGRVPLSDLLFFFRQLATMLHAGVGMVQTFETLSRQTKDAKLVAILRELVVHTREGRPMSFGMQRYPEVFSPLVLSMIRVGEESGTLDEVLRHIADYLEREIRLRNLIRRQTLYPKIVLASSVVIILAANAIITAVGSTGTISTPLTNPVTWVVLTPIVVGLWLFVRLGLPNPGIKSQWEEVLHRTPYLGETVKMMAMAKFARALAAMYRGGVPLPRAASLAIDSSGSEVIRTKMRFVPKRLEEGHGLTASFAETNALSPMLLDMMHTGESTGNVDDMLDKIADFYEDDAEVRAQAMAMVLGVVCLLLVGAYVLYIAVTFYGGRMAQVMSAGE